MRKHIFNLVFTSFLMCIYSFHANAYLYDEIEKQSVAVTLAADKDVQKSIIGFIETEVRSIPDLELEKSKKQWVIDIVVFRKLAKTTILSITILERLRNEKVIQNTNPEFRKITEGITSDAYYYEDHWVIEVLDNDFMKASKEIVDRFNSMFVEKRRQSYREIRRFMTPSSKPEPGA